MILIHHGQTEFSCIAREAWSEIVLVTHWGFIKAVTRLDVALQMEPT
jgi:hypothetical protein